MHIEVHDQNRLATRDPDARGLLVTLLVFPKVELDTGLSATGHVQSVRVPTAIELVPFGKNDAGRLHDQAHLDIGVGRDFDIGQQFRREALEVQEVDLTVRAVVSQDDTVSPSRRKKLDGPDVDHR